MSGELDQLLADDGLASTILFPTVPAAIGAYTLELAAIAKLGMSVKHDKVRANWYHALVSGYRSSSKQKLRDIAVELLPIDQDAAREYFRQRDLEAAAVRSGELS